MMTSKTFWTRSCTPWTMIRMAAILSTGSSFHRAVWSWTLSSSSSSLTSTTRTSITNKQRFLRTMPTIIRSSTTRTKLSTTTKSFSLLTHNKATSITRRSTSTTSSSNRCSFSYPIMTQNNYHSHSKFGRGGHNTNALFMSSSSSSASTSSSSSSLSSKDKVVAEGIVVSQFDKVTAIQLLDDNPLWFDSDSSNNNNNNNNNEQSLSSSPPSKSTATASDDLQGRKVIFPNQSQGVVIAHRPPVVFVYSITTNSNNNNNNKKNITTTEEGTMKQEQQSSNRVHIMSSRLEIPAIPTPQQSQQQQQQKSSQFVNEGNQEINGESLIQHSTTTIIPNSIADTVTTSTTVDESSFTNTTTTRALFAPIPQVKDISLINVPMLTGITMIDTLSPIGRGQNMLFVGHNVNDMRRYAIDFLMNQIRSYNNNNKQINHQQQQQEEKVLEKSSSSSSNVACIYAAIDNYYEVNELLKQQGIRDMVHVVAPSIDLSSTETIISEENSIQQKNQQQQQPKSNPKMKNVDDMTKSAQAILVASTACAIAESWAMEHGTHAVIVVDTIDWHKTLWDCTTRVLVDVFGVDAVVQGDREGGASSEMRAFYSSLIQRSAQYKITRGGGSITLLLLTRIPSIIDNDEENNDDDDDNNNNNNKKNREDTTTIYTESDFDNSSDIIKERIKILIKRNIPLTKTNLRKIDIPIPSKSEGKRRLVLQHVDDLISMSDGQIWLDERLEQSYYNDCDGTTTSNTTTGQCPPMDPQRSFTRIGIGADTESRADAPALRRIVQGLRLILQQASSMDGAELNMVSKKQTQRQQAILLAMHQPSGQGGRTLAESCAVLLSASCGYLDHVAMQTNTAPGTVQGKALIQGLLNHLHETQSELMQKIDDTLDLQEEQKTQMLESIENYFFLTVS